MRFVDEFRDPELANVLIERLHQRARLLPFSAEKPMQIMEVCGGHTHAIFKFGLDQLLPPQLEFIHGPGCPVCVLPMGRIDACCEIAAHPEVIFCTFGDALRVPGKQGSLLQARERGADVRVVYSPLDALKLAREYPHRQVVFFALGFETTLPVTAVTLQKARREGMSNFSIFCQHISLIPTLRSLLQQHDVHIDAFLAPGHVSMVIGTTPYNFISEQFGKPLVISGFEPLDMLQSVLMLVEQFCEASCKTENQYRRVVAEQGNLLALDAIREVFQLAGSSEWRGLGLIAESGISLTDTYAGFDAERRFTPQIQSVADDPQARCGDVLTGRCKPHQCPLFGHGCTPHNAFGALMVSSEGACAAWYQYRYQESEKRVQYQQHKEVR
ncbi:hydrogenase formation protein HypD [Yersinia ruckeri]|uniref:Hydrogenase maturation factor n=1 Tax=Yersinia ruckeri TaxID=29486 RepID=A0A085U8B7_YERRU|nr:hydrogenase formation protein HypD [Yersinia ruckeri]AKA37052.1 hydrogenase isoenzymes formation protein HypD [Yersinia ruckeri]ARZ01235.1 hydrogenase isoenzymes formation protein [Yersinia ruckeri]AUQ43293.1 hydrogenase formation protein HypD [Yersinia ruckeri]EEP98903.1 Hydrogenase expression/formation protein HypD [Yersinia ruckeri ATCC 29473]EKN3344970.1 hydrogenase formation protein HypD [Yersinia ruckeri]